MWLRGVASILRNCYEENYVETRAENLSLKDLLYEYLQMPANLFKYEE